MVQLIYTDSNRSSAVLDQSIFCLHAVHTVQTARCCRRCNR